MHRNFLILTMFTRSLIALVTLAFACPSGAIAASKSQEQAPSGTLKNPVEISPDTVVTVYAKLGSITSITLLTEKPVESVIKGGPEINHLLDGNVIHIQPLVPEGTSTVTFRVESVTYVIRVRIGNEDPVVPNPVFSFAKQGRFDELDRAITSAGPMKPSDIDLNGAIRTIERASRDTTFKATLKNYGMMPIRKIYVWNNNEIHFLEAHQFADIDLIVFKISWVNQQNQALYLNKNQYKLFIGDKPVPSQVRQQLAPKSIVFPGQLETVWLGVQGYKLRLDNDWDLRLPPDAKALRAYIRN